jgi:hypothetical protein
MAISGPSPFNCNAFARATGSKGASKGNRKPPTLIPAGVFKAKCLAIMDEVQAKSQPVIGKPVIKLVPVTEDRDDIFGFLQDKMTIVGDVVSPVIPLKEWKRLK